MTWIQKMYKKIVDTKLYKWLDKFYTAHPLLLDVVLFIGEITVIAGIIVLMVLVF